MRKSLSISALALGTMLALSACGGTAGTSPTSPNVEPLSPSTTSAAAAPEVKKSPRGNIVKELGQPASINTKDGKPMVNFVINTITPDVPCTGAYPRPAENGHLTVLDVSVETTAELGGEDVFPKTFDINATMFKFVGASGTTYNGDLSTIATYSCLPDTETITSNGAGIGPAEKVTGKVVLDLPETTGTLVFKSYMLSNAGGWEYNF